MSEHEIDAGDTVRHRPTGETWTIAGVENGHVMWLGWPEGYAEVSDCTLIKKATAKKRLRVLHQCSQIQGHDIRKTYAMKHLEAARAAAQAIPDENPDAATLPGRIEAAQAFLDGL